MPPDVLRVIVKKLTPVEDNPLETKLT